MVEETAAVTVEDLRDGEFEVVARLPWSSNATFLARLAHDLGEQFVVYKPQRGERPLWDFPVGSLCAREVAAYEVSEALGWAIVPPTVLRDGPLGPGMVQLFVDHDPDDHYLELRDAHPDRFRQFAAFDAVINNADRKSGHCIVDTTGHIWGIDHGVSFHVQHKLRTVIWDFAGEPLPPDVVAALEHVVGSWRDASARLGALLDSDEVVAVESRVHALLTDGSFPGPRGDYPYPWPLV